MDALKWITVEYTIAELKPQGGVVTQRDILQKYKDDHPDKEVRAHANFKCNQENKTISIRIAIATAIEVKILDEFADKDNDYSATQKLLNPEYDEVVAQVEGLKKQLGLGAEVYDELAGKLKHAENQIEEFEKGRAGHPCLCKSCVDNIKLQEKYDALKEENDRLILQLTELDKDSDTGDLAEAKKVIAEDDSVDFKDKTDG